MKFEYGKQTFTGSRKEIIESFTQFLKEESLEYYTGDTFKLGEESIHLTHHKTYFLNEIKDSLIKQAVYKVPPNPHEIVIELRNGIRFLLIDGIQLDSQKPLFTINQILKHSGVDNVKLNFDIKVEFQELLNNSHALYLDHSLVACQEGPFTIFELINCVMFFNRIDEC